MRRTLTSLLGASALLLGATACSDDSDTSAAEEPTSTTAPEAPEGTRVAEGEDIELDGSTGLGSQTLNIYAEEANDEVTGEFQVSEVVVRVDCGTPNTGGITILVGEVTTGSPGFIEEGALQALVIREGEPDSVSLYANDSGAESCNALLESIPDSLFADDSRFVTVGTGSNIWTG